MTDALTRAAQVFVALGVLFLGWIIFIWEPGSDTQVTKTVQVEQRYYSA